MERVINMEGKVNYPFEVEYLLKKNRWKRDLGKSG
jgi:hypothetical protein